MAIRALVMSGGGAKGAFQVGAVDTLVREQKLDFDVIAGVSAGALNALVLAQASGPGGLARQVEELERLWLGIGSAADVYRQRFLGKALAFVLHDSVYDSRPLRGMIERHGRADGPPATWKPLRIGVTWLETGEYESVDQHHPALLDCTLASSSMPVLFRPVRVGDRSGVDGGVRNLTPLDDAFDALKERAAASPGEPLEMVVLLASPVTIERERGPWRTGLAVGQRALSMLVNEIYREDLRYALAINRAVRSQLELRRRLEQQLGPARVAQILSGLDLPYGPPHYLPVRLRAVVPDREFSDALEFDPRRIREAMEAGRRAARGALDEPALQVLLEGQAARRRAQAA